MDEKACAALQEEGYFLDLRTLDSSFGKLDGLNDAGTALNISDTPFLSPAGFSGKIYLGVVQNAPHPERSAAYIRYLLQQ